MSGSVIRKITRGVSSTKEEITISCSITDPDKVVVLLDVDGCCDYAQSSNYSEIEVASAGSAGVYLVSVSTTGIVVKGKGFKADEYSTPRILATSITFSYQIIEFM